jgi:hypothetical protein
VEGPRLKACWCNWFRIGHINRAVTAAANSASHPNTARTATRAAPTKRSTPTWLMTRGRVDLLASAFASHVSGLHPAVALRWPLRPSRASPVGECRDPQFSSLEEESFLCLSGATPPDLGRRDRSHRQPHQLANASVALGQARLRRRAETRRHGSDLARGRDLTLISLDRLEHGAPLDAGLASAGCRCYSLEVDLGVLNVSSSGTTSGRE